MTWVTIRMTFKIALQTFSFTKISAGSNYKRGLKSV